VYTTDANARPLVFNHVDDDDDDDDGASFSPASNALTRSQHALYF
jgi:hypothetical protein